MITESECGPRVEERRGKETDKQASAQKTAKRRRRVVFSLVDGTVDVVIDHQNLGQEDKKKSKGSQTEKCQTKRSLTFSDKYLGKNAVAKDDDGDAATPSASLKRITVIDRSLSARGGGGGGGETERERKQDRSRTQGNRVD